MLTAEQIESYKKGGFILLDGIFSKEEIQECSEEYDTLFERKKESNSNLEAQWAGGWTDEKKSVLSIHNLQCHSAVFTRMLLNPKLTEAVSEVVGSPNILLHHTKAHIKPPQVGAAFPTHQDYHYFPFKNDSMVAVFIHLDDSEQENGGLAIFPGTHLLGPLQNCSDVPTHFYVDQAQFSLTKAQPVKALKGQVLIFSYLLVHGSYPNISTRNRRMLYFQMMSAEDEPLKGVHLSPCHGMVLRGQNVKRNADVDKRFEH